MARKYEGSAEDEAEDARGAKAMGVSKGAYERTPRDKREDAAGEHRAKRKTPPRRAKVPPAPPFGLAQMPGEANEPDQEEMGAPE